MGGTEVSHRSEDEDDSNENAMLAKDLKEHRRKQHLSKSTADSGDIGVKDLEQLLQGYDQNDRIQNVSGKLSRDLDKHGPISELYSDSDASRFENWQLTCALFF